MKRFLKITLNLFIFLSFSSCENPNPPFGQLPPITTEGKGTFGYKVDGEVQGQCYDGLLSSLANAEIVGDTSFILTESCNSHGINIVENNFFFSKLSYFIIDENSYLRYSPPKKAAYFSNKNDESIAVVELLKFDTLNQIISGTFKGTLFNENGESVEITDGRFDLVYKKY
jgi:hypothetical protein